MASLSAHTLTGFTKLDDVTAKDSFLKNPDLMAITFSHLQENDDIESKRCALNTALVCKDFLDVALDVLWEKLYSLVPLLKLLPGFQFENDACYVCANVHIFYTNMNLLLCL